VNIALIGLPPVAGSGGSGASSAPDVEGLIRDLEALGHHVERATRLQTGAGAPDVTLVAGGLAQAAAVEVGRPVRVGLTFNLKRVKPSVHTGEDGEAEFDGPETVEAIRAALASFGHEVVLLEARPDFLELIGPAKCDVVFNIAEGLRGRSRESVIPAVLELLDIPYTGSDPATMSLALDKGLAKRVVRSAGVPTAEFASLWSPDEALPPGLDFPLIVKPVAEGSSKGVLGNSVVTDRAGLEAAVRACVERYDQPALVEAFLSGREFTVGLLGGADPEVLPPMEIVFTRADDPHPTYTFADKQTDAPPIRFEVPAKVDDALAAEIRDVVLGAWHALGCRDVARIDVRCDGRGRVHFIECNPLPGLTPGFSDLCLIAQAAGISYEVLIGRILAPALARIQHHPPAEADAP
jgi:D-alanine--D-alanine ligase